MQNNSTIKPAEISLTGLAPEQQDTGTGKSRRPIAIGVGLFVLATLVFAVLFILPDWQDNDQAVAGSATVNNPADGAVTQAPAPVTGKQPSPWSEAQLARQRKATQDILSQMLKQQDKLEQIGVRQWAPEAYTAAGKLAEAGDALYRQREYNKAKDSYQKGLDALNKLLKQSESVFSQAITTGFQAIDGGNSDAAQSAFKLALLIKPDNASALKGRQRADTLDQVLQLMAQGDELLQADQLEQAESTYRQVLKLDPDTEGADNKLATVKQKIIDRDFTTAMSDGYAALEDNRLDDARQSFKKAARIKPSAAEARNALRQTEDKLTVIKINKLLSSAAAAEKSERWQDAASAYGQALKLDANLAAALTGKQNATLRDHLDKNLNFAIDNPLRLADESVYKQTRTLYQAASRIQSPGPRLREQLATLTKLLQQARTPLAITFRSDNLTDITLYKTGDLGRFVSRKVSLVPGHYIVVGRRDGYQDVRVEFTIDPNKPIQSVIVQCEDKISF